MSVPIRRLATYDDLMAVPSNLVAEILDGALVTHPRPLPRHAIAKTALGAELLGRFQKTPLASESWIFFFQPELHLGDHVVVPDIAGWRRSRMTEMPNEVGITLPPDWLCEVLSSSTASYDRTVKFRIYHQHHVGHLWYLDPAYRTLEVFGWTEPHWAPLGNYGDFEDVSAAPFDAITFSFGALWPFDQPPATAAKSDT